MLTDEQTTELRGMVGDFDAPSVITYVESLRAQARAEAFEEAAKLCAEPERREDYMGGKTWVECAAAIRARKDAQ